MNHQSIPNNKRTGLFLSGGRFHLPLGKRTLLMGVLNVTPDSFSDGGAFFSPRKATSHAIRMQAEGADLIDVGAESTRPGARPISAQEEIRRLLPVIEKLVPKLSIPISVDTAKAKVAKIAIEAGASLINDVSGLRDPQMPKVLARANAPVIVMHMRGTPATMQRFTRYRKLLPEIVGELKHSLKKAKEAGIPNRNLLVDPGIGFSKDAEQNLVILKNLEVFKKMGFPVVVGPSRKSFIGKVLAPPSAVGLKGRAFASATVRGRSAGGGVEVSIEERLFGTAAAVALSVAGGADVVRVHDVAPMRQVADLAWAIRKA